MIVLGSVGIFIFYYACCLFPFLPQPLSPALSRIPGRFGFHEIWHVAVVMAAASHWMLMYFVVLPWNG
jgi:predicted membrane channel-forming protein YqfA (hemolysin III family)